MLFLHDWQKVGSLALVADQLKISLQNRLNYFFSTLQKRLNFSSPSETGSNSFFAPKQVESVNYPESFRIDSEIGVPKLINK